jgi:hypothetical protein
MNITQRRRERGGKGILSVYFCNLQFAFCILQFAILGVSISPPISIGAEQVGPHVNDEAVAPSDLIRLLEGNTLDDCYTWLKDTKRDDPRRVFRVKDGVLHITGDGLGGLVTNKRYRNYHLVLEFKWGQRTWGEREDNARDSGLLVHSNGIDGGYQGTWMPAIEVQIIEGGVGDFVPVPGKDEHGQPVPIAYTCHVGRDRDGEVVWDQDGQRETFRRGNLARVNWYGRDPDWKDAKDFRGTQDQDSPLGQWTRLDVLCEGSHITTFVNGKMVNEAFDVSPREGRLQLQSELAEIFFRRWELWPLGKGPKPGPAKQE